MVIEIIPGWACQNPNCGAKGVTTGEIPRVCPHCKEGEVIVSARKEGPDFGPEKVR